MLVSFDASEKEPNGLHPNQGTEPVEENAYDYDVLPYVSLPITYTDPARLAALAKLHGLAAPDAAGCRVLELGCAAGGNIVPLAVRHPNSSFVGIDLSQRHVDEANNKISRVGARNIEVWKSDLAELRLGDRVFDFIICHGVYSWVSPEIQKSILMLCSEHLAPHGIAAISYNVLPGWHLRHIVRDICLRNAPQSEPVRERVALARAAIDLAAGLSDDRTPYGRMLREEAGRLALQPASYVLGEFLSAHNSPCYFRDFARRALEAGLTYLSEGDLSSTLPAFFVPMAAKTITTLAASDPLAEQEFCDVFSGRTFRRSILVRSVDAATRQEVRPNTSIRGLHIAARLDRAVDRSTPERAVYLDHRKATFTCTNPEIDRTLQDLGTAYPSSVSIDQLLSPLTKASATKVERALLRLVAEGRATLSTLPLETGTSSDSHPKVWDLARLEADMGQPWSTSLKHTAVKTSTALRHLISLLDGTRTRDDLAGQIEAAVKTNLISISGAFEPDHRIQGPQEFVNRALDYLDSEALVV